MHANPYIYYVKIRLSYSVLEEIDNIIMKMIVFDVISEIT